MKNRYGHESVHVVAKEPLDDVLQAVQVLDGFGERVEASGATGVQVDVLRAFLRVPGRQNRDIVIALDLAARLRVSRRNLLRRRCLGAIAALASAQGRRSLRQHRPRQDDRPQLRWWIHNALGVTDEAEGGRVESDVSDVVDNVCGPFPNFNAFLAFCCLIMCFFFPCVSSDGDAQ